jgi:T5SS/PEP-CTERM-associated repeat protein
MKTIQLTVTALLCLTLTGVVCADDYYWTESSGGDYGTASYWTPSGPPGSSDNAYFELDSTYTVTFDDSYIVEKMRADAGQISFDLNSNQYDITWTAGGDDAVFIGDDNAAELTVFNSGSIFTGNVIIGREYGSHGILNIDGTDTLWQVRRGFDWYSMFIGGNGWGELHVSNGGMMDFGAGSVATHYPSKAFITVDGPGSVWRVDGFLAMGDNGTANVQVTNQGAVNVSRCDMASNPSAQAFMTVIGKDNENNSEFYLRSFSETSLTIGRFGSAHLTCLNNGKIINEGHLAVAAYPGSFGELTLSESSADIWRSVSIGGRHEASGGTAVVNIFRDGVLNVGQNDPNDMIVWPGGAINLCEGTLNLQVGEVFRTLTLHGRLTGAGTVIAEVSNPDGVVAPSGGFNITPDLEIQSNYTQGSAGRLKIAITKIPYTDPPQFYYGKLNVYGSGTATLDGYLDVTVNDYVPGAAEAFTIIDAPMGITGRFINTPGNVYIGSSGTFDVQYKANSVVLTNYRSQACTNPPQADLNGDCTINLLDFAVLADEWLTSGLSI